MEGYVPGEEGETDLEDDEIETSNVVHITQTTMSSGILGEEEDPNASFVVGSDGERRMDMRPLLSRPRPPAFPIFPLSRPSPFCCPSFPHSLAHSPFLTNATAEKRGNNFGALIGNPAD